MITWKKWNKNYDPLGFIFKLFLCLMFRRNLWRLLGVAIFFLGFETGVSTVLLTDGSASAVPSTFRWNFNKKEHYWSES